MATYWHGQAWSNPPPRLTRREAANSCYWSMWQRRRAPYGALAPGDHLLVVDTFRRRAPSKSCFVGNATFPNSPMGPIPAAESQIGGQRGPPR
jgi:hypothetical protein